MNFYNPYFSAFPVKSTLGATKKFSFSSLINGTTKVLNLINQGIPVIKQTYPVIKNAKTMFSVLNEFKKTDIANTNDNTNLSSSDKSVPIKENNNNYPTFFI